MRNIVRLYPPVRKRIKDALPRLWLSTTQSKSLLFPTAGLLAAICGLPTTVVGQQQCNSAVTTPPAKATEYLVVNITNSCVLQQPIDNRNVAPTFSFSAPALNAVPNNPSVNYTEAFQAAAAIIKNNGGHGKIIIPAGSYTVGRQTSPNRHGYYKYGEDILDLTGVADVTVEGEVDPLGKPSSIVQWAGGLDYGSFGPDAHSTDIRTIASGGKFMLLKNATQVTFRNVELNGNIKQFNAGGTWGDVGRQIEHDGILVWDSDAVTLTNISAHHFGHDGILINNATPNGLFSPHRSIALQNCHFDTNGRNGLSWVSGIGLTATNCTFNHNGDASQLENHQGVYMVSMPIAGCDIEPETGVTAQGAFNHCQFHENGGPGLVSDGEGRPYRASYIHFEFCSFLGTTGAPIFVEQPRFSYTNCQFYGTITSGYRADTRAEGTNYVNCLFSDKYAKDAAGLPIAGNTYPAYGLQPGYVQGKLLDLNFSKWKRATFERCEFVAYESIILNFGVNTPDYILIKDSCRVSPPLDECAIFKVCHFKYGSAASTTAANYLTWAPGAAFVGSTQFTNLAAPTNNAVQNFRLFWNRISSESSLGTVNLNAAPSFYGVECPGLKIGDSPSDPIKVVIGNQNTLQVQQQGYLKTEAATSIVVEDGGVFSLVQHSLSELRGNITIKHGGVMRIGWDDATAKIYGNITVEDGGTLQIFPRAIIHLYGSIDVQSGANLFIASSSIYPELSASFNPNGTSEYCGHVFNIASGANLLTDSRVNFSGVNLHITGGHTGITPHSPAPTCPAARPGQQASTGSTATADSRGTEEITVYPVPFDTQTILRWPATTGKTVEVNVLDGFGRTVQKLTLPAQQGSVELGNDWKPGLYLIQVQSVERTTTTRVAKN
ncbi:T9SS type A sorting domain-containing protein [Hymenobacter aquaticus]|uniref:T9SS type A sorting domain-containing protein n=1 Tax=Hymenobacter aquaticus TaxID=1867101 RepID=A0A4Z0PXS3_9BACT|nr:right-handed parallel beta-helix repeat-containing protein [Hymenobacter aquaticus]TGE22109.1 T9SS type A sorting domain-containing protein [Hymenobacter aquaticus]